MSILSFILLLPLLGAGLIALWPREQRVAIRAIALATTSLSMLMAVWAFAGFTGAAEGLGGFKYVHRLPGSMLWASTTWWVRTASTSA